MEFENPLRQYFEEYGIKPVTVELFPRMTLFWFQNQITKLEICPKCKKYWLNSRNDMCLDCYLKALTRFERRSRERSIVVR